MKIYTRTGDDGTTSLAGGKRVPKSSYRVEAYGSVDEVIAWIGLLRTYPENSAQTAILINIQDNLMKCAAVLASTGQDIGGRKLLPDEGIVKLLENEIDNMEKSLPPLKNFILPGGRIPVSYCHIARCVCRRAERAVLRLNETEKIDDAILKFINRLSDYLFVLARKISYEVGNEEIRWSI
jgi:cob(I)alamin adenosyltransferase